MLNKLFGERKYFKLLFIIYIFSNTLALGYFGITFNPLGVIVFLYGLIVLFYNLIKKELFYTKNHLLLIGLYGVLLCIATYGNKQYSTTTSYIMSAMQMLIFLLIFGQPKSMTLKKMKDELKFIIPLTSSLVGIASFVSLLMYFFNISGYRNGWYLGLVGDRLFGVYFNCNPASFLAVIVILLSLIAIKNQYRLSKLYYVNIVIQLSYIILTQCRAAIIILAIVSTAVVYYYFFRSKEMSKLKTVCINLAMCVCILSGTVIINKVVSIIPQLQGANMEDNGGRFHLKKIKEIVSLTMSGELANIPKIIQLADEVSSMRISLARDSLKIWQSDPLDGIGAFNFRKMLVDNSSHPEAIGQQILHTHNVFLETLVTTGIFGFIIFFLFFMKSLFVTRDILIKYRGKKSYYIILLFIMIFVSEFIGGMLDFGVFYIYSLSATLAWMFLGYIYWLNDQPDTSLIDHSNIAVFNKYELITIDYHKEELDNLKPGFIIMDSSCKGEDYIIKVKYILGESIFVYNIYYSINGSNKNINDVNKQLAEDFYSLVKDEINGIYRQSNIK